MLTTIGQVANFQKGFAFKSKDYQDRGTKIVRVTNLNRSDYSDENSLFIANELALVYEKYNLLENDIVVSTVGSWPNNPASIVGKVSIIPKEVSGSLLNQNAVRIRAREECTQSYLGYVMKNKSFTDYIIGTAQGSASQASITLEDIKKYEFELPNIEVQKKQIAILEKIDLKILTNSVINKNLVEQAISLYSHMFIENFSPEWKEGTLSEIATITMGQSPKGDTYNEDGDGTVFYQGRAEFGFRFPTRRLFTTDPKRMAEENDVLMSVRAPVGDYNVATERCCIGRGLASIRSLDNHQSFVLYSIHFAKQQLDVFNGEGTVFGSINRDGLNSLSIVIPDREAMDKFETIASAIDKKIRCNQEEIIRLQSLRDSLLPKLMSGEIDVSEINI